MSANRPFTMIAAILFLVVALAHAYRLMTGCEVTLGGSEIPQWISWIGLVIAGGISFGLFREARR